MGGVVYHTNYIKYCERARSEVFLSHGVSPHHNSGFFVVKNLSANYIKPAKFGDIINVQTKIKRLKKVSIELSQTITNNYNVKMFTLETLLVFVKNSKPISMPAEFVDILNTNLEPIVDTILS